MPTVSVHNCRITLILKACVWLPAFLCLCTLTEEVCWPQLCVAQSHALFPGYEVLHPFALGSLCFVLPGLPGRPRGGEVCWLAGFWLRSRGSKPGNVLNGRCVPSATGLIALLS